MKVNFLDLGVQYESIKGQIDDALSEVLKSCAFTSGKFVSEFEEVFAKRHDAKYCVGVNNGTASVH